MATPEADLLSDEELRAESKAVTEARCLAQAQEAGFATWADYATYRQRREEEEMEQARQRRKEAESNNAVVYQTKTDNHRPQNQWKVDIQTWGYDGASMSIVSREGS